MDEVLCDAPLVITKELLEDNNIDVVVTATERGEPSVDKYVWCCAVCYVLCAVFVLCVQLQVPPTAASSLSLSLSNSLHMENLQL